MFRTSAEREAALLQQILAPALRSRNPERRKEAVEALENLAAVASHLKHLLLVRDLQADRQVSADARDLRDHIRDIPDFPKPGIVFKDITPLLLDPAALDRGGRAAGRVGAPARDRLRASPPRRAASSSARRSRASSASASCPPASRASCPHDTVSAEYILEYGVDALEMHADALADGARVLLHDDLLATGGTAKALARAGRGPRRADRRLRVPRRAGVPRRPRAARGLRRPLADLLRRRVT